MICPRCGSEFLIRRENQQFCSRRCAGWNNIYQFNTTGMRHHHRSLDEILLDSRTSNGDAYEEELPIDVLLDGIHPTEEPETTE